MADRRTPLLGTHVSIAGGIELAPERGEALGCDAIQVFTKNNSQWRWPPLKKGCVEAFRRNLAASRIRCVFSHTIYLINLGASDSGMYEKSVRAMVDEVKRAELLGLDSVVVHPGSHTGSGEEAGLRRVVRGLNRVHRATPGYRVKILLETTAGQGSNLGYRFEHLAFLIAEVEEPDRLGVCFDTCHVFAAGYDIRTREGYRETMRALDSTVGLGRVLAFHLNDSKTPLGSRRDRHEHIGKGSLGTDAFRFLLNDPRFRGRPMVLETPKSSDLHEDVENLRTLRSLLAGGGGRDRP